MAHNKSYTHLVIILVIFAFCLSNNGVYAFGAGNIPSFSYIEGKAFRHGDIEDVLAQLSKGASGFALANLVSKGSKFSGLDIKRVYFGNWLRDYSQAVDIAGLKKLPLQTIVNLCMVLGFLAHGYATHEFEVTPQRLACYLPTEHIDNPKGYGDGEDPRKYHPGLRGPVDPRELEIDPRTGMKNYIANENGTWDTSKALVRRTFERCIQLGRQHRKNGQKQDLYEAYRLLGQGLHTLEDFPAHSNFCELALVSIGHSEVFTHVGDQVRINAPNGRHVAPLITGTFGSSDFIHSLLGEASDKLSSASVTDLNREIDKARSRSVTQTRGPGGPTVTPVDALRDLMFALPGGQGGEMSRDLDNIQRMRDSATSGGKKPEEMSPQELHSVLWQVLTFRDSIVKKIEKTIEKIPGLGPLIEKLIDAISVFVLTTLEPFVKPLLKTTTSTLQNVSGEVIDNHDQYEVFNDPRASDPTHSFLSKDHFNLILNEPAGIVAKVIVVHSVKLIINAWENTSVSATQVADEILQCLFHPDFHNPNSKVQREMLQAVRDWVSKLRDQWSILKRLTKNAVRMHENIRIGGDGGPGAAEGSFAQGQAHQFQQSIGQSIPLFGTALNLAQGNKRDVPGFPAGPPPSIPTQGHHGYAPPSGPPPTSTYSAPSGPPPSSSYYQPSGAPLSSYAPPPGPPPQQPPYQAPNHAGYAPSYAPAPYGPDRSSSIPAPSFPGLPGSYGAPSSPPPGGPLGSPDRSSSFPPPNFPGMQGGYGAPSAPPVGPPGFPVSSGGYSAPPGPPPSFPSYGGPPQFPQQQYPQQHPDQSYQPPYGGGW